MNRKYPLIEEVVLMMDSIDIYLQVRHQLSLDFRY